MKGTSDNWKAERAHWKEVNKRKREFEAELHAKRKQYERGDPNWMKKVCHREFPLQQRGMWDAMLPCLSGLRGLVWGQGRSDAMWRRLRKSEHDSLS